MLSPGTRAPDFELPGTGGKTYRLRDALERGALLLYFYPMDFTPTCTREACMFRDALGDLEDRGLQIWGVNARSLESHEDFARKNGLNFPLLVDADHAVARMYEALAPLGLYVRRVTYLISPDGEISDRASGDFGIGPHSELLQRALSATGGQD